MCVVPKLMHVMSFEWKKAMSLFLAITVILADLEINFDEFSGPMPHKLDYVNVCFRYIHMLF